MENLVQAQETLQDNTLNTNPGQTPETNSTGIPQEPVQVSATGIIVPDQGTSTVSAAGQLPDTLRVQMEAEKKISSNVMSICLTSDGIVIKEEDRDEQDELASRLSGVYCEGVQYYDLNGITYINNTGMAILIDLLKSLLEMGVEVQFVNVHDSIRKKIRDMGLEKIFNTGDSSAA